MRTAYYCTLYYLFVNPMLLLIGWLIKRLRGAFGRWWIFGAISCLLMIFCSHQLCWSFRLESTFFRVSLLLMIAAQFIECYQTRFGIWIVMLSWIWTKPSVRIIRCWQQSVPKKMVRFVASYSRYDIRRVMTLSKVISVNLQRLWKIQRAKPHLIQIRVMERLRQNWPLNIDGLYVIAGTRLGPVKFGLSRQSFKATVGLRINGCGWSCYGYQS